MTGYDDPLPRGMDDLIVGQGKCSKCGMKISLVNSQYHVCNHLPDAGNKVEPSGDSGELAANHLPDAGNKVTEDSFTRNLTSDEREYYGGLTVLTRGELEQLEREAFESGVRIQMRYEGVESSEWKATMDDKWNSWQSTRDNSRGKEATND